MPAALAAGCRTRPQSIDRPCPPPAVPPSRAGAQCQRSDMICLSAWRPVLRGHLPGDTSYRGPVPHRGAPAVWMLLSTPRPHAAPESCLDGAAAGTHWTAAGSSRGGRPSAEAPPVVVERLRLRASTAELWPGRVSGGRRGDFRRQVLKLDLETVPEHWSLAVHVRACCRSSGVAPGPTRREQPRCTAIRCVAHVT